MIWRFIPYKENTAMMNMAIDESILEHIKKGASPPTIRLYGWNPSAVTIGTFQCRSDEVDLQETEKLDIDVVRRMTGGGAVYHDRHGEVTYSIIAPENLFEKDIIKSYKQICDLITKALTGLGLNAEFKPINDLIIDNKKISGNAQTRRGGVLLQHGTILFEVDVDRMFTVLKVDKVKVSDKFVQSVKKIVTSICAHEIKIEKEQLIDALRDSFLDGKNFLVGNLTYVELDLAKKLAVEKYSSEEWNDCRK